MFLSLAASDLVDKHQSPTRGHCGRYRQESWRPPRKPLPDVAEFEPQVGDIVPDFLLVDQFGDRHDLAGC